MKHLNRNALKLIAAGAMLLDHIGYILLPKLLILRIIGRISFPLFAFMIAEGCRYTRNKLRYFFRIFLLGVFCQVALYLYQQDLQMGILISFSIAILLIYLLQRLCVCETNAEKAGYAVGFFLMLMFVQFFSREFVLDYGFWGCMLPVVSYLSLYLEKRIRMIVFGIGVFMVAVTIGGIQWYSFASLLFLFLYSGERGVYRMKYFFYLFYPVHLLILQGISLLIS